MQFVILGLLLLGPQSLYDLHKQFGRGVSLFYSASFGSLQRALHQLVADGLVTVADAPDGRRGRKLHTITAAGTDAWREWMLAPSTGDAETTMLAKVFLAGSLPDLDERTAVIDRLRERVDADLRALESAAVAIDAQSIPPEYDTIFAFQRATLDYGIRAHLLAADWLGELARSDRPEPPTAVRG